MIDIYIRMVPAVLCAVLFEDRLGEINPRAHFTLRRISRYIEPKEAKKRRASLRDFLLPQVFLLPFLQLPFRSLLLLLLLFFLPLSSYPPFSLDLFFLLTFFFPTKITTLSAFTKKKNVRNISSGIRGLASDRLYCI